MNLERAKKYAVSLSIIILTLSLSYLFIFEGYYPHPPYWIPITRRENTFIGLSLLITLFPYSILVYYRDKWLDGVDQNVPRLLQDVTEDVRSGQSLIAALEENTKGYGPITSPLERALIQFKFTSDYSASFKWLGEQLVRPVAKQMAAIFIEAYEAGGRVAEILQESVNLFKSIDENQTARYTKTKPYVLVVFVSLGVFLGISWVILNKFLIPMNLQTQEILGASYNYGLKLLDIEYYSAILFWCAMIESILGGLIAGKISKGKTSSGLIYSVIMILVTVLFFNHII